MRPNVVLKQLSINVGSSDQSYMPQHVVVTAGRDEQNLREISDCRIPRYNLHYLWTSASNKNFCVLNYMQTSFHASLENLMVCQDDIPLQCWKLNFDITCHLVKWLSKNYLHPKNDNCTHKAGEQSVICTCLALFTLALVGLWVLISNTALVVIFLITWMLWQWF